MDKELLLKYIEDTQDIEFTEDVSNSKHLKAEKVLCWFKCLLTVNRKKVPIYLKISQGYPRNLPRFYLPQFDTLGFLPHILPSGWVCYLEKESVYINIEQPKIVFQASVELVVQTLKDGLSTNNWRDFREEFNVYWEGNNFLKSLKLASFIEVGEEPKVIKLLGNSKWAIAYDLGKHDETYEKKFLKGKKNPTKYGLYIPLKLDCSIIPPNYSDNWTADQFIYWLKPKVLHDHWKGLTEIIKGERSNKYEYLILGIPRQTGSTLLVAVHLESKESTTNPILSNNSEWQIELLSVSRIDPFAHLPRGGARIELQDKSILLVGCGSVGSHISLNLAKMGIGNLSLLDDDRLNLENILRFAVGFEYSLKPKVKAVKEYLDKNHLNTSVTALENTIESFIDKEGTDLSKYDLIISATGDPTTNMYLNQVCRKQQTPLLVTWNEPYSVGGHAQLSISPQKGCYKCMYRDQYNIASFAAKDQPKPFHKKHLGCGEVYTPYNALDSSRTSEIASRLAVSFLSGEVDEPQILSWKGQSGEFTSNGFALSTRYLNQTQEQLEELKHQFVNTECAHCR